jgi:hypothetical protein
MADGDLWVVGGLQDVAGDAFEHGDVRGRIVLAGADGVFAKMDIKHPVEIVLDLPVCPHNWKRGRFP